MDLEVLMFQEDNIFIVMFYPLFMIHMPQQGIGFPHSWSQFMYYFEIESW